MKNALGLLASISTTRGRCRTAVTISLSSLVVNVHSDIGVLKKKKKEKKHRKKKSK